MSVTYGNFTLTGATLVTPPSVSYTPDGGSELTGNLYLFNSSGSIALASSITTGMAYIFAAAGGSGGSGGPGSGIGGNAGGRGGELYHDDLHTITSSGSITVSVGAPDENTTLNYDTSGVILLQYNSGGAAGGGGGSSYNIPGGGGSSGYSVIIGGVTYYFGGGGGGGGAGSFSNGGAGGGGGGGGSSAGGGGSSAGGGGSGGNGGSAGSGGGGGNGGNGSGGGGGSYGGNGDDGWSTSVLQNDSGGYGGADLENGRGGGGGGAGCGYGGGGGGGAGGGAGDNGGASGSYGGPGTPGIVLLFIVDSVPPSPGNPTCFLRGSKILCLNEGLKEEYMAIEDMRAGTPVKTLKGTYVRVYTIGKTIFNNPDNADRGPNRLFKLTPQRYPELTEDLIITGCHSILVDKLEPKQKTRHLQLMDSLYMTTGKFRLMAFIDEKAEPYMSSGHHEIWHFALENKEPTCNYGVYANGGLLVETASIKNMIERSGLVLIK